MGETMADNTLKISVESVIHKQIAEALQTISDQHRIAITGISAEWVDTSSAAGPSCQLKQIELATLFMGIDTGD